VPDVEYIPHGTRSCTMSENTS